MSKLDLHVRIGREHVGSHAQKGKTLRQDADDRVVFSVESDCRVQDVFIGSELPLPKAVGQHDDRFGAGVGILGDKSSAPRGSYP